MQSNYPKHHYIKEGHISACQICNNKKLHKILDLGHQPLCAFMLTDKMLSDPETTYPLRMMWCEICTCAQIDYCVDSSKVYYPGYPYRSGITKELAEYQENICHSLINKYNIKPNNLVIDIGSNDGTLLSGFIKNRIKVLGVEPTNIAKIARKNGIRTIQAFFDIELSKKIRAKYGPASVITATNMFAHMQTLGEVIMGIYNLLTEDGVFISETHYLLDVIAKGQFDTIYHEHLRTYSLKSLVKLFNYYDFTLIDVERGSRYGGNLRIHAAKGKGKKVSPQVIKLLKTEEDFGLGKIETYRRFAERVQKARLKFMDFIIKLKKKGKSIVGNSCPGRCSTLLNYYGVDKELLPYLAEQPTSLKLNMYLPGKHIPVVDNKRLIKEQPNFVVLLAWHYAKPIMQQLKARGLKSDFVIPLPDFKVVKNSSI
ncbi:methyltransferase domain-containing protein [Candidatus Daviesbacteria bacterium]|nr:methyltransferase domain-containing protein [Candidatus Daviesbacteria bacterium]